MFTEDKRNFLRMQMDTPARLTTIEPKPGLVYEALCIDISATGIAIQLNDLLELDTLVQVYINSTHPEIAPLQATAKVVRASQEEDGTIEAGLEIIRFD